jgi:predicted nucleotide-binding protein (sugar kinase/HSP70/actin superfamily)
VVLTGDFIRITERPDFDPGRAMFFFPSAQGPCRLGQYTQVLAGVLRERGQAAVHLLTPSDQDWFAGLGSIASGFRRMLWRAFVATDVLYAALLRTRPYEVEHGAAQRAFDESLDDLCATLRSSGTARSAMRRAAERFRRVSQQRRPTLVVGVVGEVVCRLNAYANAGLVAELERQGAEVRMSGACELLDYCAEMELQTLRVAGRRWSAAMATARLRTTILRRDRRMLEQPFAPHREPETAELLTLAAPYLPGSSVIGEMVVTIGKAVWLARNGADGVIDASPFGCMNGIVSEAICPRVSRDHGGIPIRNLYFDGTHTDLESEVGTFLELAQAYRRRRS